MAERRVAEIVAERDGLGQLLVQVQHLRDRARDLRDLERVRQPRAVVIARRREEHLRLVLEAAERLGVDDAIAIALERRADVVFGLRPEHGRGCRRSWPPAARESRARALRAAGESGSCDVAIPEVPRRKLVPCASGATPKFSASVWPRSANVARVPEIHADGDLGPGHQQRHVLPRMVRARRRRIVAVIGGDDEQIVGAAGVAAARAGGRRSARGSRHSRPRRSGGRTACRSPRG